MDAAATADAAALLPQQSQFGSHLGMLFSFLKKLLEEGTLPEKELMNIIDSAQQIERLISLLLREAIPFDEVMGDFIEFFGVIAPYLQGKLARSPDFFAESTFHQMAYNIWFFVVYGKSLAFKEDVNAQVLAPRRLINSLRPLALSM